MEFKKDDIVTVKIEDMSSEGQGIGRVNGYALFIKDAMIGDEVRAKIMKAKKQYAFARLVEIINPSPDRVKPRCPVHRQCGGCQLQALSYEKQLIFKENKIKNNLVRIGGFSQESITSIMEPIIGMEEPYRFRNKSQFPVGRDKDGHLITGFYAHRTHCIIPNTDCCIGIEENKPILESVLRYMEENHVPPYEEGSHSGLVRHVLIRKGFQTGELMVCLIINGKKLPAADRLTELLRAIPGMTSISYNINMEQTNVILGGKTVNLWGQDHITDYIKDVAFHISPVSFYQVNPVQTEKLYSKALEYAGLTGQEIVWDLYCGIGTISLFLAKRAKKVYGVEIVEQAIEDAKVNAKLNGIENASFFAGKSEEVLPQMYGQYGDDVRADVVVLDPPRKGCDGELLATLLEMAPKKIVYVSCDSATLARDLKVLCDGGYALRRGCGVDLFGHGGHVESVVLMSRKDK